MKAILVAALLATTLAYSAEPRCAEIAVTMDDFDTKESVLLTPQERNRRILATLDRHGIKAGLFVVARNVTTEPGAQMLKDWGAKGHLIGNHTFSHPNYHSKNVTYEIFSEEFRKADAILKGSIGFRPFFRFPMSHEGDTLEKRDKMQELLGSFGYRNAHLTIDASDWYISDRLRQRIRKDPKADLTPYRDYFLRHIWDRSQYYRKLSKEVLGREIKYNVVLHFNLLNALFLDDLLTYFEKRGCKWINAADAFEDPIYSSNPNTLPAGQSLIWALAKETGRYDNILRYPGEDGKYEKEAMDKLGL